MYLRLIYTYRLGVILLSLYTIGDLHLSFGTDKPMDIFKGWDNYTEKIDKNWRDIVKDDDTIVVVGDISWATDFNELYHDFCFIHNLPGRKIMLKGNHDFWFSTKTKVDNFIKQNQFYSINILFNNSYTYNNYGLCGTRGWMFDNTSKQNSKILLRELGRLEISLKTFKTPDMTPFVFMHYPPIHNKNLFPEIQKMLKKYNVKKVFYGHLHGDSCELSVNGIIDGIEYRLVSSDFVRFCPYKIM